MSLLDGRQPNHERAKRAWSALLTDEFRLVTSNYVVIETIQLIQRRIGIRAVLAFSADLLPALDVAWVDTETHHAGLAAVLAISQRDLGVVDCISFEVMRRAGIKHAFAFDGHFERRELVLPPLTAGDDDDG
jgi:predicted nucleic acid-binding protein